MNKNLDALVAEFKTIEAAYQAGTMSEAQAKRLDQLPGEIDQAQKHAGAVDRGDAILRRLSEGATGGQKSDDRRLGMAAFRAAGSELAKKVAAAGSFESKAASVAGYETPMTGTVVSTLPAVPQTFIETLPHVVFPDRHISYLQQGARDLNAAVVAPGALKPESNVAFELKRDELRVFAHVSGAVDEYLIQDVKMLETLLNGEMLYGLATEFERQALYGAGTGEIVGLANTSGIQVVSTGASALLRVRKAITNLEVQGFVPRVVVLNPSDWEAIETATTTSGEFVVTNSPLDALKRQLWGVQVAVSTAVTAGEGFVLDTAAVAVASDGVVKVNIGQPGDTYLRNQFVIRAEGRFNVMPLQPLGVVRVTFGA